jgi:hypothetical protein
MTKSISFTRLLFTAVALVAVVAAAVLAGSARADNPPPVISVGPVSDPNNTVTASGSASSQTGKTDACVNQQHSGTAPPPSDAKNGVQVNDSACQSSTSTSTAGGAQNGTGSPSAGVGRTTSAASGSSGARKTSANTASAKRSRSASATAAVSASQALGLRITRIRYLTNAVQTSKRLRLLVTVRDLRGRLVRDAIVSIRGVPGAKLTITSTHATFSNRLGQAGFLVRVPKQTLGKRLVLLVAARTPKARALTVGSVRLPAPALRA